MTQNTALADLMDTQSGALAEAQALADVLELVAVSDSDANLRDSTSSVLARMLSERLATIRDTVDLELVSSR